jgi:hypothetical protein
MTFNRATWLSATERSGHLSRRSIADQIRKPVLVLSRDGNRPELRRRSSSVANATSQSKSS